MNHSVCCVKNESCGPHLRSHATGVFKVNELNDDINNHLVQLKLQYHYKKNTDLNERTMIENRRGCTFQDLDIIGAFHRKTLSIAWKPSLHCQHPSHASIIQMKAPPVRSVPLATLKKLNSRTDYIFDWNCILFQTFERFNGGMQSKWLTDSILVTNRLKILA